MCVCVCVPLVCMPLVCMCDSVFVLAHVQLCVSVCVYECITVHPLPTAGTAVTRKRAGGRDTIAN